MQLEPILVSIRYFRIIMPGATVYTYRKTIEQLKFHSFRGLWAFTYFTKHIRARGEIYLEVWLSSTSHVRQYRLSKMPSEKFIGRSFRITAKPSIEELACDIVSISCKMNDFVIILLFLVTENLKTGVYKVRIIHQD